jgi:hypothetical protein
MESHTPPVSIDNANALAWNVHEKLATHWLGSGKSMR